jgi:hypothetical protein
MSGTYSKQSSNKDKLELIEERFKVVSTLGGDLSRFPLKKTDDVHFDTDKEKSRTFAEVFTPLYIVDEMLNTVPGMSPTTSNLDLCSGYGQFSIRMLRKLYEENGEGFDVGRYLTKQHFFAELQISSCYKLLWIFSTHINLAIGDALQLGRLPKGARGVWYYLEPLGEWVDVTGFVRGLYGSVLGERARTWPRGKLFTYSMDKEAVFVKTFEAFVGRLTSVCKEPRMNLRNIINTKSGRQALIQFAAEAATGIEKNWQKQGTPEWVVREMVAAVPEIQTLKRILVLFNIEFLECLIKERGIDPAAVDFGYDSEIEGAIAERVYGAHAFSIGKSLLDMQLATSGNAGAYDVVFSNPPYQTEDGGFGASARPVYHEIVMYTIDVLKPRYVCMITPSRWMAGGKGLNDYRARMLADKHIRIIQDFPGEREVFPTVSIKGGVSYFLWDRDYNGLCDLNGIQRDLSEFDVLVRDNTSAQILRKVLAKATVFCDKRVFSRKPFGLPTNFKDWVPEGTEGAVECMSTGKTIRLVDQNVYTDSNNVKSLWKVLVSRATMEGASFCGTLRQLLMGFMVIKPNQICTETYIVAGSFQTKKEADSYAEYMKTRFYRYLLSLRVITQDINREKFAWVPDLGNYSEIWTDAELYQHFGLTKKEQEHVDKSIKTL